MMKLFHIFFNLLSRTQLCHALLAIHLILTIPHISPMAPVKSLFRWKSLLIRSGMKSQRSHQTQSRSNFIARSAGIVPYFKISIEPVNGSLSRNSWSFCSVVKISNTYAMLDPMIQIWYPIIGSSSMQDTGFTLTLKKYIYMNSGYPKFNSALMFMPSNRKMNSILPTHPSHSGSTAQASLKRSNQTLRTFMHPLSRFVNPFCKR